MYKFAEFLLDPAERRLLRDGVPVPLSPKCFDTLLLLVEHSGRTMERSELIDKLWPDTFVEENNLSDNISKIRQALGDSRRAPRFLETVSKRGYRFVARVEQVEPGHSRSGPSGSPGGGAASMAVLPFRTLGAKSAEDEYLGLGIADALVTGLSNIRRIVVRPTSAILKYGDPGQDSLAAGREQRVDMLLEGTIQRGGNRVRVAVQLVRVSDGVTIWAGKFDEDFTDIFSLQDSISEQLTRTLSLRLSGQEQDRLKKRYTENTEAYMLYLKGRYYWNKGTEGGIKRAVRYFNEAIAIDPGYALAYTGLSVSYSVQGAFGIASPEASFPKARWAAERAVALDDNLSEAHSALGAVRLLYEWDWTAAESELKRAIELNPNHAEPHELYGYYLETTGRVGEAIKEMKRALELEPLSLNVNMDLGQAFYLAREYESAVEQYDKAIEIDPGYVPTPLFSAQAYERMGLYEKAIAECGKVLASSQDHPTTMAVLGYAYAASGRRSEAQQVLNQLIKASEGRTVLPYAMALIYTGLGRKDDAFTWLEEALKLRDAQLAWVKVEPQLECLHPDARFHNLLKRMGLEP